VHDNGMGMEASSSCVCPLRWKEHRRGRQHHPQANSQTQQRVASSSSMTTGMRPSPWQWC
jgi:hypothetical protein